MYLGIDSVGIDMQPKFNQKPGLVFFFAGYMIIGGLFIMNLFVGVVIDNFNKIKEQAEVGGSFVTDAQRQWIQVQTIGQKLNFRKKTFVPNDWRKNIYKLVHHTWFENFVILMVLINTLTMSSSHYQMPV
jgi:ABC-type maltose transport system permease subunit